MKSNQTTKKGKSSFFFSDRKSLDGSLLILDIDSPGFKLIQDNPDLSTEFSNWVSAVSTSRKMDIALVSRHNEDYIGLKKILLSSKYYKRAYLATSDRNAIFLTKKGGFLHWLPNAIAKKTHSVEKTCYGSMRESGAFKLAVVQWLDCKGAYSFGEHGECFLSCENIIANTDFLLNNHQSLPILVISDSFTDDSEFIVKDYLDFFAEIFRVG